MQFVSTCPVISADSRKLQFSRLASGYLFVAARTSAKPFEWANSSGRRNGDGLSNESLHKKTHEERDCVFTCLIHIIRIIYISYHILCDLYDHS